MSGFSKDTPVSINDGQYPRPVSKNPPTSQTSQGPAIRSSLKNEVPQGHPGGIQVGTPMDKAATFSPTPGNVENPGEKY